MTEVELPPADGQTVLTDVTGSGRLTLKKGDKYISLSPDQARALAEGYLVTTKPMPDYPCPWCRGMGGQVGPFEQGGKARFECGTCGSDWLLSYESPIRWRG